MKLKHLLLFLLLGGCSFNRTKTYYLVEKDKCDSIIFLKVVVISGCVSGNSYINPPKYKVINEDKK